jgi:hypothetical protein
LLNALGQNYRKDKFMAIKKTLLCEKNVAFLSFVFNSTQVYWIGIFILPKKIMKTIELKFNQLLWSGKEDCTTKAKVA